MIIKIVKVINPTSVRQLIRDYRLPMSATFVFIAIVIVMVAGRLQERSVLGQILAVNSSGSQGYANLLSKDKADLFVKNDVGDTGNSQTGGSGTTQGNTSSASQPAGSNGGTSVSSDPGSTPSGGTTTPAPTPNPVFSASITDFRQDRSPELQCSSGSPNNPGNLLKCNKIYSFAASVQAVNGPGSVSYSWKYSVSGSNGGNFAAAGGTSNTTLRNEITLSCKSPGTFTAQFVVTSPNSSQSQTMQINHNCSV